MHSWRAIGARRCRSRRRHSVRRSTLARTPFRAKPRCIPGGDWAFSGAVGWTNLSARGRRTCAGPDRRGRCTIATVVGSERFAVRGYRTKWTERPGDTCAITRHCVGGVRKLPSRDCRVHDTGETHVIEAFLDLFPGRLFRDVEYAVVIYVAGQAGRGCSRARRRERAMRGSSESGGDGTRAARTLSAGGERDGGCARQPLQRRHSEHRLDAHKLGQSKECSRRWLRTRKSRDVNRRISARRGLKMDSDSS